LTDKYLNLLSLSQHFVDILDSKSSWDNGLEILLQPRPAWSGSWWNASDSWDQNFTGRMRTKVGVFYPDATAVHLITATITARGL
jgi:hypothetical protein